MDKNQLTEKAFALVAATLKKDRSEINPESKLAELSEDSIQLFELVLAFEREFGLAAEYEDLITIVTVQDIVEYLAKKLVPTPPQA
jgi:acyl carrier protein